MGLISKLSTKLRERRRTVAAVLASAVIGLGIFLAGTWAGSSGTFTPPLVGVSAQHAPDAPEPGDKCCGKPMNKNKMGPNVPGGMPTDQMRPSMPGGIPMEEPVSATGKKCCDK